MKQKLFRFYSDMTLNKMDSGRTEKEGKSRTVNEHFHYLRGCHE
ncbi:hypothetical protein [Metabacillus halosaccharovorans]|nr:hypothetical protein [Metabacillus halosaccharovorans]